MRGLAWAPSPPSFCWRSWSSPAFSAAWFSSEYNERPASILWQVFFWCHHSNEMSDAPVTVCVSFHGEFLNKNFEQENVVSYFCKDPSPTSMKPNSTEHQRSPW